MAEESNRKNESLIIKIARIVIGIFWDTIRMWVGNAIKLVGFPFLAFVLVCCLSVFAYCWLTGTPFEEVRYFFQLLEDSFASFFERLQELYPGIEYFFIVMTPLIEFIKASVKRLMGISENNDDNNNASDNNTHDQCGHTSPGSLPQRTYIRSGLYTHDFKEVRGTVVNNGRTLVNSVKISCKVTNDNPRSEKIIFEPYVYFPKIDKVEFLNTVTHIVPPYDTIDVDDPCPVDINPKLFDKLSEEEWIICIRCNRKTVYREEFICRY